MKDETDHAPWIDSPESTWAPMPEGGIIDVHLGQPEPRGPRQQWLEYEQLAEHLSARFEPRHSLRAFQFIQSLARQQAAPERLRRPYATPVAYTEWGPRDAPVVLCVGGVANTAMRFAFLANELRRSHRVICMDWVGRGRSGWLADDHEYTLDTYVEQMRQMLDHLRVPSATVIGSSMGGTAGIALAARDPSRVERLVLNDIGAHVPQERRQRRAETLARFYVFRNPEDLQRRIGAAHKNDGPISDAVRLFITYHQTRWSPENAGRIYRADPRAMVAFQREAQASVDQWDEWGQLRCPVMLVHGMESDALLPETIERMRRMRPLTLMHVPKTGHTPVLCDRQQMRNIGEWLHGDGRDPAEFSVPLAAS